MKGKFIVLEGLDVTGKSSTLNEIKNLLNEDSTIVFTREPGGLDDKFNENLRELILNNSDDIDPLTEAYLFASDRANHTRKINKLLEYGKTVICDRYVYSSLFYQGAMNGLQPKTIFDINKPAINSLHPDMIIYFVASDDAKKERMNKKTDINKYDEDVLRVNSTGATIEFLNLIHGFKPRKTKVEIIDTSFTTSDEAAEKMLQILTDNKYI